MKIRKMAVLAQTVRADVQVGINQWGGAVTVTVELPRKADEVQTAMAALENLLLREAQAHIKVSSDRAAIRNEVETKVNAMLEGERVRIEKDVEARHAANARSQQAEIGDMHRRLGRQRADLIYEIEQAFHAEKFPGLDRTQVLPVITEVLRRKN